MSEQVLRPSRSEVTPEEYDARTRELLAQEATEPEGWWWLSFVDTATRTWKGACVVRARGLLSAVDEARRQGCNPGGQVKGMGPIEEDLAGWANRLLSKADCDVINQMEFEE